jgi:hypothetical protein
VAQAVQRPVTAATSTARAAPITAPRPQPVRHHRSHRRHAPVVHGVASPDVTVPVPTSRIGASSRGSLLGIAGALLLALAAAGAAVTVREIRT